LTGLHLEEIKLVRNLSSKDNSDASCIKKRESEDESKK